MLSLLLQASYWSNQVLQWAAAPQPVWQEVDSGIAPVPSPVQLIIFQADFWLCFEVVTERRARPTAANYSMLYLYYY